MLHSEVESALTVPAREAIGRGDPIRILFIITTLQTGGAEMMLYKLLATMDRQRFDPRVICLGGSGTPGARIKALGVPVYVAGVSPTRPSPALLWKVCRLARDLRPDLVQGWMYHGNAVASLAQYLWLQSIPVLWSVRHSPYSLRNEKRRSAVLIRLSAIISHRSHRVIYASHVSADQHEALGFAADRTTIIPNGFDCEEFKPSSRARIALRKELGVGDNTILIGLMGRYHAQKDHPTFLEAACRASKTQQDVHFVLAGHGVDPQNRDLARLIDSFRLNGRVHLLSERNDMPDLTAALDIATSASSFGESFPNVIGEAMACGVPCVVTDVGHSAVIVGDTGLVVPPRNPAALAASLLSLIDMETAARARLGAAARQRIVSEFSLRQIVRQYEAVYDEALQHKVLEA
jgi:glycosyltransferase involved in cell wall biosynthesis